MPGIGLVIDPVSEDAANVPLSLSDGIKFRAMKASYPIPPRSVNWASSADTEGALPANLRYENRTITIECRVIGSSASDLQTQLGYLEQKVGKINEEEGVGGTHEYVSPSGTTCVFDVLEASADYDLDNTALANRYTTVTIVFTAKPFWRSGLAHEVEGVDHVETTLPCVIGVDTAIGGDVPAVGRLVVDDDQGQDQWTLIWGVQSRYYDASADAALFYQAETREPQGGAATAEKTGASGSGKATVAQTALLTSYQSMLSTQAAGGGNHLRHVGTYRVYGRFLRPLSNTGEVSVCLEWGEGDLRRRSQNTPVTWAPEETEELWRIADLGLVYLSKAVSGSQRWEGKVLAKSTVAGDDLYLDCLMLFPVDEGYGTSKTVLQLDSPSALLAQDPFAQSAGALTGKVAALGGTWSGAGDADDFSVTGTEAIRTAVSDVAATPRYAILGTAAYGNIVHRLHVATDNKPWATEDVFFGSLVRYIDVNNWVALLVTRTQSENWPGVNANRYSAQLWKKVAGTKSAVAGSIFSLMPGAAVNTGTPVLAFLELIVLTNGFWQVGFNGTAMRAGIDAAFNESGALKEGKVGIYDGKTSASAETRSYDGLEAFAPLRDAAVFASQSCEIRSDRALREDLTGTVLATPSDYRGSYFRPPPARREARSIRTIVKLSRGNIDTMPDPGIDDASFKVFWQARGLAMPES
jgi:hypothetical protein